jgi:hypothetical protein
VFSNGATRDASAVKEYAVQRWIWGLLMLATFALPPMAVAQDTTTPVATPRVSGADVYIGMASDDLTSVAIVVDDDGEARAYLCDGSEVSHWLLGSVSAGTLALHAEDGATVSGQRAGDRVSGTATLPNGGELAFTTERASGVAGRYESALDNEGRLTGTSTDGRHIVGAVTGMRARNGETMVFAGLIETPDGTARAVAAVVDGEGGSVLRLIVQADGSIVGRSRTGNKSFLPANF